MLWWMVVLITMWIPDYKSLCAINCSLWPLTLSSRRSVSWQKSNQHPNKKSVNDVQMSSLLLYTCWRHQQIKKCLFLHGHAKRMRLQIQFLNKESSLWKWSCVPLQSVNSNPPLMRMISKASQAFLFPRQAASPAAQQKLHLQKKKTTHPTSESLTNSKPKCKNEGNAGNRWNEENVDETTSYQWECRRSWTPRCTFGTKASHTLKCSASAHAFPKERVTWNSLAAGPADKAFLQASEFMYVPHIYVYSDGFRIPVNLKCPEVGITCMEANRSETH